MNEQRPLNKTTQNESMVFIVDDDAPLRESLGSLLRSIGLRVELFGSVAEFMKFPRLDTASCLVLDVRLQGSSGLDFQCELAAAGIKVPIVFITGYGDIAMTVRAMKAGAVDFLTKPFREQDLIDAVCTAHAQDRQRRESERHADELHARHATLSAREQTVMALATSGLMNKQIAGEIGLSEITVKIHRGQAMRKMGARSFADLVRMAEMISAQAGAHLPSNLATDRFFSKALFD
ncbi:MAG: response regulator transcription factor [Pseudomonas sp.]|uniref:response regulator transcription factor n=1 Tax=Pseudomonas sp. TaxID=306 RepID=UPI003D6F391E